MKDARQHERVRTILGAQIIFNHNNSTLDCQIRNISSGGAKLIVTETVQLPGEFDIYVPQRGRTYRARLRWRSTQAVGVEFLRDEAPAAPAPAPSVDLAARVHELEQENDLLRRRVLDLMVELEKAREGRPRAVA
jgi:hypothetical protein